MTGQRRRREFPEAFKREAVERVRTSGMTIIAVANELGLHETVLRRWIQRYGEPGAAPMRRTSAAASCGPSPADLAAENARLKRELDRARMERDILKKAALIFGGLPDEVRVRGRAQGRLADLCHVRRARRVRQRALTPGDRGPRARGARPTGRCSTPSAWCTPRAGARTGRRVSMPRLARPRPARRPPPGGPADAARGAAGARRPAAARAHDRQPARTPHRAQPARPQLRGGGPEPGVARRSDLRARPARVGCSSPPSSTCTLARSSVGPCARRCTAWIALEALEMAVQRQRPAPGLIRHTDRGIQGGLNRSSQHPDDGDCDDDEGTAF